MECACARNVKGGIYALALSGQYYPENAQNVKNNETVGNTNCAIQLHKLHNTIKTTNLWYFPQIQKMHSFLSAYDENAYIL